MASPAPFLTVSPPRPPPLLTASPPPFILSPTTPRRRLRPHRRIQRVPPACDTPPCSPRSRPSPLRIDPLDTAPTLARVRVLGGPNSDVAPSVTGLTKEESSHNYMTVAEGVKYALLALGPTFSLFAGEDWASDPYRGEMRTKRKGHKVDHIAAEKRANTDELTEKMPQMLLDYKVFLFGTGDLYTELYDQLDGHDQRRRGATSSTGPPSATTTATLPTGARLEDSGSRTVAARWCFALASGSRSLSMRESVPGHRTEAPWRRMQRRIRRLLPTRRSLSPRSRPDITSCRCSSKQRAGTQ